MRKMLLTLALVVAPSLVAAQSPAQQPAHTAGKATTMTTDTTKAKAKAKAPTRRHHKAKAKPAAQAQRDSAQRPY